MHGKTKQMKDIKAANKNLTVVQVGTDIFMAFSETGRCVGRVRRIPANSKDGRGQPSYKKMEHDGHTTLNSLGDKATPVADPSAKMLRTLTIV